MVYRGGERGLGRRRKGRGWGEKREKMRNERWEAYK